MQLIIMEELLYIIYARTKYGIELDLNATDNDGMTPMDLI